jgi:hypothetical protein
MRYSGTYIISLWSVSSRRYEMQTNKLNEDKTFTDLLKGATGIKIPDWYPVSQTKKIPFLAPMTKMRSSVCTVTVLTLSSYSLAWNRKNRFNNAKSPRPHRFVDCNCLAGCKLRVLLSNFERTPNSPAPSALSGSSTLCLSPISLTWFFLFVPSYNPHQAPQQATVEDMATCESIFSSQWGWPTKWIGVHSEGSPVV